jgi:hypothetical protein
MTRGYYYLKRDEDSKNRLDRYLDFIGDFNKQKRPYRSDEWQKVKYYEVKKELKKIYGIRASYDTQNLLLPKFAFCLTHILMGEKCFGQMALDGRSEVTEENFWEIYRFWDFRYYCLDLQERGIMDPLVMMVSKKDIVNSTERLSNGEWEYYANFHPGQSRFHLANFLGIDEMPIFFLSKRSENIDLGGNDIKSFEDFQGSRLMAGYRKNNIFPRFLLDFQAGPPATFSYFNPGPEAALMLLEDENGWRKLIAKGTKEVKPMMPFKLGLTHIGADGRYLGWPHAKRLREFDSLDGYANLVKNSLPLNVYIDEEETINYADFLISIYKKYGLKIEYVENCDYVSYFFNEDVTWTNMGDRSAFSLDWEAHSNMHPLNNLKEKGVKNIIDGYNFINKFMSNSKSLQHNVESLNDECENKFNNQFSLIFGFHLWKRIIQNILKNGIFDPLILYITTEDELLLHPGQTRLSVADFLNFKFLPLLIITHEEDGRNFGGVEINSYSDIEKSKVGEENSMRFVIFINGGEWGGYCTNNKIYLNPKAKKYINKLNLNEVDPNIPPFNLVISNDYQNFDDFNSFRFLKKGDTEKDFTYGKLIENSLPLNVYVGV